MNTLFFLQNTDEEIMDTYDEDIIVTTREGKIIKVTQISGEHYGVGPTDLLGKSVYDLEAQGIFSPAITPQVVDKKKKIVTVQNTPSGRKVLITGIPLLNDIGEVEFVISYSYEMSELILMKEYLQNMETEMSKVKNELAYLRDQQLQVEGCIMESASSRRAVKTAVKVAHLKVPVVIQGERGTGKTTLAKFIHSQNNRNQEAFIEVDCSTIPNSVFELSFTGLEDGYLTLAEGGTLVLNEIDQLSQASQAILFKLLQGQEAVRVIAISETSLEEAVTAGTFREDLFYFLHLTDIQLKPLRERPEDLDRAITQFLVELNEKYKEEKHFSDDLYFHLLQLSWDGNFRELRNVLERSFIESESEWITLNDLPVKYQPDAGERIGIELDGQTLPLILEAVEKKILINAQKRYRTTTEMANVLGISQPSVVRKLKKHLTLPLGDEIE